MGPRLAAAGLNAGAAYDTRTRSLLDAALSNLIASREATYSRPLAFVSFTKETITVNGQPTRVAPRLKHGGAHLSQPYQQWLGDVLRRSAAGSSASASS